MKGWQLTEIKNVQETTINEPFDNLTSSKVKITKALINSHDILRYTGEIQAENIVLGSYGIGVISEPGVNLFDLNKGSRVYINPKKYCENCYNCKSNNHAICSNLQIACEDYNGFLRDFVTAKNSDLHYLPDFISDDDALFI